MNQGFLRAIIALVAVTGALLITAACSTASMAPATVGPLPFAQYQRDTMAMVAERRRFQGTDRQAELTWNSPGEWQPVTATTPASRPSKGVLLVHGLGDSPWSFHDIAPRLAADGFLVRSVLLPGHGTQPRDLLDVTLEQWRQVVLQQTLSLLKDVDGPVYLGGFSTGANLVLELASARNDIAGLLLFSPGFKASTSVSWMAPLIAPVLPWLRNPETGRAQNATRYLNTPTNGFAQFHRSAVSAQQLLEERKFERPVFMVVAENDSVLDAAYLLRMFQQRFTHPASRLIWYGEPPSQPIDPTRVLVRPDHVPEQRISHFSHMGVLFSPANPLYGVTGSLRICQNGQRDEEMRACEQGAPLWFSDWGYREPGKVHARLTFNPYFDWQSDVMRAVFASAGGAQTAR